MKTKRKYNSTLPHHPMEYLVSDAVEIREEINTLMNKYSNNRSKKSIYHLLRGFLDVLISEKRSEFKNEKQ